MKRVVNTNEMSISDVVEAINKGEKLIVFYRSQNKTDGIPVFLTMDSGVSYFRSAICNYGTTYLKSNLKASLEEASRSRNLYVLTKEENGELFKISN